jgi:DNA topoisomerase-1
MSRRGGWRRTGSRGRFRYRDARGEPITDEQKLRRIEALAIPPAWRDVWISPNPGAKLQATGVDAAGRTQYRYHPDFRAAQESAKFERLVRFGELLPELRAAMAGHTEADELGREWACAIAVRVINLAWFRVGSERSAAQARTYGVTTLRKRHVTVRGKRISFRFAAKGRASVRTTLVDEELGSAFRSLLDLPGARLFRYRRDDGLCNLTAPQLNEYLAEHLGGGFTAKDFRTWGGTLTAAIALAEHGPPASEDEAKRVVAAVMRTVGERLGNTPSVARASYVSPAVVEQYLDGRTLEDFRPRRLRVVGARDLGLDVEEAALLSLLRSWRVRRALAA